MTGNAEVFERVEFDATFDELLDVGRRFRQASPAARRIRRNDIVITSASVAIGVLVVGGLRGKAPLWLLAMVAVMAFVITVGVYSWIHDRIVERRTRALVREGARGASIVPIVVELTGHGVVLRSSEDMATISWPRVKRINDLPEGIEIIGEGAVAMVRSRAFGSPEDRQRFLDRARSLATTAGH